MSGESNNEHFHVVLLDTNIWVHTSSMLRTPLGASLIYALRRTRRKILLPEIVELEVRRNAKLRATELVKETSGRLDLLRKLLGRPFPVSLPDDDIVEGDVTDRLVELGPIVERLAFSLEHARSALHRVVEKRPPSVEGQQYKDCVIWEAALEAAASYPVCIVTEDKGFFDKRNEKAGPWPELVREAAARPRPLVLYYGLKAYLQEHGVRAAPLPADRLAALVEEEARSSIEWKAEGQGLTLHDLLELSSTPFLTADPDDVVYGFSVVFRASLEDPEGGTPYEGAIRAEGEMTYEPERESVDDIELTSLWFHDQHGRRMGGWSRSDEQLDEGFSSQVKPTYELRYPLTR